MIEEACLPDDAGLARGVAFPRGHDARQILVTCFSTVPGGAQSGSTPRAWQQSVMT